METHRTVQELAAAVRAAVSERARLDEDIERTVRKMADAGLTQRQIADQIDVSQPTVHRILRRSP